MKKLSLSVNLLFICAIANAQCLVAYYPFTGNANDSSGNGNNGIVNGATLTTDRFGNASSAYSFNGSGDYIDAGDVTFLDGLSEATWNWWISTTDSLPRANGNDYVSVFRKDSSWIPMQFANDSYDYWHGLLFQGGVGSADLIMGNSGIVQYNGNWIMFTLVKTTTELKFYKNSSLQGSVPYTGTLENHNTPLLFGRAYTFNTLESYNGKIDDIRIYSCALPDSEIAALYNGNTDCLVAYYPFTGNANDSSGNGLDGIVNGAILTADRFGNANSAYSFDGVNNNITVLNNPLVNIDTNQSFSVSLWIKHNGNNSAKYFLSKYNGIGGANPSYAFGTQDVNNPGGPYSWFEAAGFSQENRDNTTILTDNNWHHYVCVFNSGNNIKLYIDNHLTVSNNINYTGSIINGLDLVIGAGANLQQNYSGSIDEIRIYSCALSDSDIAFLYGNFNDAVNETTLENYFTICPNPASSNFTIRSHLQYVQVEIYSILGEKKETVVVGDEQSTINIENYSSGVYFVKLQSERGSVVRKLVVE